VWQGDAQEIPGRGEPRGFHQRRQVVYVGPFRHAQLNRVNVAARQPRQNPGGSVRLGEAVLAGQGLLPRMPRARQQKKQRVPHDAGVGQLRGDARRGGAERNVDEHLARKAGVAVGVDHGKRNSQAGEAQGKRCQQPPLHGCPPARPR